jgi:hypothetical protein
MTSGTHSRAEAIVPIERHRLRRLDTMSGIRARPSAPRMVPTKLQLGMGVDGGEGIDGGGEVNGGRVDNGRRARGYRAVLEGSLIPSVTTSRPRTSHNFCVQKARSVRDRVELLSTNACCRGACQVLAFV